MNKVMTTGLLLRDDKILLGMKKRGFGVGKWNGFGGKVKEGETIEEGFIREYEEETTIKILKHEKAGVIEFEFVGDPVILEVHFFKILEYDGEPLETEEMKPQWFKTSEIPYENMWLDDQYWMPILLSGKKFKGKVVYEGQAKIISSDLEELDSI